MLALKILLSIRKGEADSITEIHTKTPSMTDHNIYQVMECKVSSDLRLATVFPDGSLFVWIGLGHLWSFQSHKKWLVLSLQLKKKKRKQHMTFTQNSPFFLECHSLELLLQIGEGLPPRDLDASSNEGLGQVLGS